MDPYIVRREPIGPGNPPSRAATQATGSPRRAVESQSASPSSRLYSPRTTESHSHHRASSPAASRIVIRPRCDPTRPASGSGRNTSVALALRAPSIIARDTCVAEVSRPVGAHGDDAGAQVSGPVLGRLLVGHDVEQVQGPGMVGVPIQDATIKGLGLGDLSTLVESDGGGEGLGKGFHRDVGLPGWGREDLPLSGKPMRPAADKANSPGPRPGP
jgi:hypothetical protein